MIKVVREMMMWPSIMIKILQPKTMHNKQFFLFQLIFSNFYHPTASHDKCTLYSDRNLINRRNVPKDVSKNVSACKKFFILTLEARVVPAAMSELGIIDIDEISSPDTLPENINTFSKQQKVEWLNALATKVVDKYVLNEKNVQAVLYKMSNGNVESERQVGDRYLCRFATCQKSFRFDGKRRRAHEMTHRGLTSITNKTPSSIKDDVFKPVFFHGGWSSSEELL